MKEKDILEKEENKIEKEETKTEKGETKPAYLVLWDLVKQIKEAKTFKLKLLYSIELLNIILVFVIQAWCISLVVYTLIILFSAGDLQVIQETVSQAKNNIVKIIPPTICLTCSMYVVNKAIKKCNRVK